jgi:hypothetical protein
VVTLAALPERIRLFPRWIAFGVVVIVIVPMVALRLSQAKARWLRIERWAVFVFFVLGGIGTLVSVGYLIHAMVTRSTEIGGMPLLTSSVSAWVTNVLIFSLLYWEIDRGGPDSRDKGEGVKPDWLFPQPTEPEDCHDGWRPTFVDYLFLGYSTATAFSTTDVLPLTPRAKILMMLEATISLATVVVVVSRAVNILGG